MLKINSFSDVAHFATRDFQAVAILDSQCPFQTHRTLEGDFELSAPFSLI